MVDIIYDFIRNDFIGADTTLAGADNLALLLTWAVIVMGLCIFIKLVTWAFGITFRWTKGSHFRN